MKDFTTFLSGERGILSSKSSATFGGTSCVLPIFIPKPRIKFNFSLLVAILLLSNIATSVAQVTITTATNGTNICTIKAADGNSPAWTTLGNIVLTSGAAPNNNDIPKNVTDATFVLTAPAGWTFNSSVTPTVTQTGTNVGVISISSITSSAITVQYTNPNSNSANRVITISGVQAQASTTASASGYIYCSSASTAITGVTTGGAGSNFGNFSLTSVAAPTGTASQTFCSGVSPTVASLSATGTSILWYAASTGGAALATTTPLVTATNYYASQTPGACESNARFAVTAIINTQSTNPTSATASSTTICNGGSSTLTLNGGGGGTGTVIKWYSTSCGGTLAGTGNGLSVSPITSTTYYGRYEDPAPCSTNSTCASVTVTVDPLPTISLGSNTTICAGTTSANLTYSGTTASPDQYSIDYNAAAEAQGFVDVALTALPASPITLVIPGAAVANVYNYTLTVKNTTTGCVSTGVAKTITVGTTITLGSNPTVCTGTTSANLSYSATTGGPDQYSIVYDATALAAGFANVTLAALPATPIVIVVPAAAPVATYNYTVTVKNSSTGCVSSGTAKTVIINAQSTNPTSATASATTICNGESVTLTLNGGGGGTSTVIKWYTASCGGTLVGSGNGLSVSPAVTTTYYGRYEDPAPCSYNTTCATVTITVTPLPSITLGTDPLVCTGATSANLTYSATTDNPDKYSIVFSAAAIAQGFANVTLSALPASPIVLTVPGAAVAGVYNYTVSVINSTVSTGCVSTGTAKTISVGTTITLGSSPTVCAGTTSANLSYSATTGSPDQYSIVYDAAALAAGFANVTLAALPATPIVLVVPGAAAVATYNYTLTVKNSVTGCVSSSTAKTVTLNAGSTNPTSATASSTTICNGSSTTLTLNGGGGGTGTVIKWYTVSCGGTAAGTGNGLSVSPSATTTYYGRYEDPAPCSFNTTCSSVTITVNPLPTITLGANTSVCSGTTSSNQTYSATSATPTQYSIVYSAAAITAGFANVTLAALPATPIVLTVPGAGAVATYNFDLTVKNTTTGCVSTAVAKTVSINAKSTNPTSATASSTTICNGQSTTLTLNGGGGGTGTVINWYTVSCGGTAAGTGNNLSVSPAATTTYYGRYEDPAPCSFNTTCQTVTITVNPLPTITLGADPTICVGTTTANQTYSATTQTPNQYSFVYSAAAITAGFANVTNAALPATPIVHTVPAAPAGGTYSCTVTVTKSSTGCTSTGTAKGVTVNVKSADPTSATASSTTVCAGGSVTLTLNGGGGGTNTVIKWYTVSCGGTLAGTGNALSVSPASTTTYYGRYEDPAPCSFNTNCATVTITVTALPATPTTAVLGTSPICAGVSSTVRATSAGNTINWYSVATAGTLIGNSASATDYSVTPASTTTYYAEAKTSNGCVSAARLNVGTITVNPLPTITLGTTPVVHRGTTVADLVYSATSNSPTQYSIAFDATALAEGFVDVALTALPASPINVTVPAAATLRDYVGAITVKNTTTGCSSTATTFSITVSATFYSQGSVSPSNVNNWSLTRDGTGAAPSNFTSSGDLFIIQSSNSMTMNADWTLGADVNLEIESGELKPQSNNLTVGGTMLIDAGATFQDLVANGVSTFTGLVTNNGTWASTTVVATGNIIFKGGISNNGTFTAGGATFNTNNQTIGGISAMSFANPVTVTGITVTNNNTSTVSITNTGAGALTGTGGWTQGSNSTLNYAGATMTLGSFDANNCTNTVNYNASGVAQSIRVPSFSYCNIIISNPGGGGAITKTLEGTIDVKQNLTISDNTIFAASTYSISIGGDWTNNSTNATSFTNGAGVQSVKFDRTAYQQITGTMLTPFEKVVVDKGTDISYIVEAVSTGAGISMSDNLVLVNGMLKLSHASASGQFNAVTTTPSTTGLWINSGSFSTSGSFNTTFNGLLRITTGTATFGTASDNALIVDNNTLGTSYAILDMQGGTLNVAGRMLATQEGKFDISGGAITTGTSGSADATNAAFHVSSTGLITMTAGTVAFQAPNTSAPSSSTTGGDLLMVAGAGAKSITGGTFQIGNASTAASKTFLINSDVPIWNLTVFATNSPTGRLSYNPLTVKNNVLISGGTLDAATNNLDMTVRGDWTNNGGTFTGGTAKVTFDGSVSQNITGTTSTTFNGVTVNNASGILFGVTNYMNGLLTLTNGLVTTASATILTMNSGSTSTSGSASSFVNGPMNKIGTSAFEFPVGKGTKWARIGITAPVTAGTTFRAEYFATAYANTSSMAATPTPKLKRVSVKEYWTLDRSVNADNVNVTLFWENATYSGINDCGAGTSLRIAHWNGSAWENNNPSVTTTGTCGTSGSISSVAAVTSFSPFTFGTDTLWHSGLNPLPIELLSFDADPSVNKVNLKWATASEINNDYFTIERTKDGVNFEVIGTVNGAGNNTSVINYTSVDFTPYDGVSYYRLKQTDFDGNFTYSELKMVNFEKETDISFNIYPNPNDGEMFNLQIASNKNDEVLVVVYDVLGNEMYSKVIITQENGDSVHVIDLLKKLPSGVYTISATSNNNIYNKRLIVN